MSAREAAREAEAIAARAEKWARDRDDCDHSQYEVGKRDALDAVAAYARGRAEAARKEGEARTLLLAELGARALQILNERMSSPASTDVLNRLLPRQIEDLTFKAASLGLLGSEVQR